MIVAIYILLLNARADTYTYASIDTDTKKKPVVLMGTISAERQIYF